MESKMIPKISKEDKRPGRPVFNCHKCGSKLHLANTLTKKTKVKEAKVIEEVQCTEDKEESDQDSGVSEETPVEDYYSENITAFFEVTEVHTHYPKYSEDCYSFINIQYSRICNTKPARGKGYTAGASCITSILINDVEAKVNLDTGEICTCIGKDYLQVMLPEWRNHLLPIEGSMRMKTEIVVMDNCKSQHIIIGNDFLNIYGIDINKNKEGYFTISENKRKNFSLSNMPKQISVASSNKNAYKEKLVTKQLVQRQSNPSLSPKMKHELIDVLYTYKNEFASDNEPLGAIRGHEVDITLDIDRPYPLVLRRPAYSASPRTREALEKNIQELIQLGVLRKVGHNEKVEVTAPVIISWYNDASRMVGNSRELNTYTVPYRYPIPRIQETLTKLSKAKYIASMDALKVFHQSILTPKGKKVFISITHCGIHEYLRMPFGIEDSPSYYQVMMNTIFPTELSERWLIIHIDDIMMCSDSWSLHLERLETVLDKVAGVNMKISLKQCNFGFEELKALGHIFSGLSLGIDKNKVAAVLLKPIQQNKKEMMPFRGFSSYYRQNLKGLKILANSIYGICDQQKVFEMTQENIKAYEKIRKDLTKNLYSSFLT
ncbi:hypothetical protein O181_073133 [Austropuccinia psidii MF-1]|uniref:Reverse transcriptase domain-containing protein n=1 Tax=Austropuccinia psidii MF-1 TaxID=1389203 RepID=A0A9Q3F4C8_9BASI|nr:hypothetical protein [Austropuccinia psidii MF-1]